MRSERGPTWIVIKISYIADKPPFATHHPSPLWLSLSHAEERIIKSAASKCEIKTKIMNCTEAVVNFNKYPRARTRSRSCSHSRSHSRSPYPCTLWHILAKVSANCAGGGGSRSEQIKQGCARVEAGTGGQEQGGKPAEATNIRQKEQLFIYLCTIERERKRVREGRSEEARSVPPQAGGRQQANNGG